MRKYAVLVIVMVGSCLLFLTGYNQQAKKVHMPDMLSFAHRGASSVAPENTRAAFAKGVELQADFLECDVHLSKDGELVIMHDDRVDRTTNASGYISDFTLAELRQLDAGSTYSKEFAGESIMTLDELLEEFYHQVGLLIELKNPQAYPGIEEKVATLLLGYEDVSSIILQSFDVESMRKMHELLPDLQVGVLIRPTDSFLSAKSIEDLTSFATFINFNVSFINKRMVDKIHAQGGKVLVWSKKDKRLLAKAHKYGVDGVITDFSNWPTNDPIYLVQE